MANAKRDRQNTRRAEARSYQARADRRSRRNRNLTAAIVILLVLALVGGFGIVLSSGEDESAPSTTTTTSAASASTKPPTKLECEADSSGTGGRARECPEEITVNPETRYTTTIVTSKGTMTFVLDPVNALADVNNFVALAKSGFYDGLLFHRIIKGFVIQGGDPLAADPAKAGSGGPGYTYTGSLPQGGSGAGTYAVGNLVMANAGGPDSNGSQFFVVSGPQGEALPPNYSLFGEMLSGQDVLAAIEGVPVGTKGQDYPDEPVVIEKVTIEEAPA